MVDQLCRCRLVFCLLALLSGAAAVVTAEQSPPETATFSMYCYWAGEATLGRVEGVVASRIGHWGGSEIVQVDYDPELTNLSALVGALKEQRSFYSLVASDGASIASAASVLSPSEISEFGGKPRFIESKYNLRRNHPEFLLLGLSEQQAMVLNSWSYFGGTMPEVLTLDQQQRLSAQ